MSLKFIEARVVGRTDHTPTLFSLRFATELDPFTAGQFCRVGLRLPDTQLKVRDVLYASPRINGFFTMPEVPDAKVLWGLSTGTAIGPYLSFMKTDAPWQKFARIVFVHAVRTAAELTYRDQIDAIGQRYGARFQYIPMLSREAVPGAMHGRIPAAINDGSLEARAGVALTADTAHCMLCGNPDMVNDTMAALQARELRKHRPMHAGHITVEAYW